MMKGTKERVDPVIGRAEELESIAPALGRRRNNVLMVGDPKMLVKQSLQKD